MMMPVSCWYCDQDFAYAINCSEWKRDDFPHFTTSRPDTCPLTEVPEPHGRLIDLDALIDQINIDSAGNRGQYGDEWLFEDTIEESPTIIESEVEE
jgi:hypothetical protein